MTCQEDQSRRGLFSRGKPIKRLWPGGVPYAPGGLRSLLDDLYHIKRQRSLITTVQPQLDRSYPGHVKVPSSSRKAAGREA